MFPCVLASSSDASFSSSLPGLRRVYPSVAPVSGAVPLCQSHDVPIFSCLFTCCLCARMFQSSLQTTCNSKPPGEHASNYTYRMLSLPVFLLVSVGVAFSLPVVPGGTTKRGGFVRRRRHPYSSQPIYILKTYVTNQYLTRIAMHIA